MQKDALDGFIERCEKMAREMEVSDKLLQEVGDPISVDALMKKSFPEREWVWEGVLPRGELAVLSGPKGSGKTLLALDIALSASLGNPVLGIPTTRTSCAYLSLELGERIMHKRLRKTGFPLEGADCAFFWKWPFLPKGAEAIRAIIKRHKIEFVVIDVIAKIRDARTDWSDYGDAYSQLSPLREIAQDTNATILFLTHSRKGETEDPSERILGSVGLSGTTGVILSLTTRLNQKTGILEVAGNDVEYKKIPIELKTEPLRFVLSEADPQEQLLSPERKAVLETFKSLGGTATTAEVSKALGKDSNTVSFLLRRLAGDGLITSVGYGKYSLIKAPTLEVLDSLETAS